MTAYDQTVEGLGLGKWHLLVYGTCCLPLTLAGMSTLFMTFAGLQPPKYRCEIPQCDSDNASVLEYGDIFTKNSDGSTNYCQTLSIVPNSTKDRCIFDDNGVRDCTHDQDIIFEPFEMSNTIVTEFKLYCDEEFKVALAGSAFMVGVFIGSFFFGAIADKFGRKKTVLMSMLVCGGAQLAGSFLPEYWSFITSQMVAATGSMGMFLCSFLTMLEIGSSSQRSWIGATKGIPFAIGEVILGLIALYVTDWRHFAWCISIPLLISTIFYLILVPESPRWYLKTGRVEDAEKILKQMGKTNKVSDVFTEITTIKANAFQIKMTELSLKSVGICDGNREPVNILTWKDLAKEPLLKNLVIMCFIWLVTSLGKNAVSLASSLRFLTTFSLLWNNTQREKLIKWFHLVVCVGVTGRSSWLFAVQIVGSCRKKTYAVFHFGWIGYLVRIGSISRRHCRRCTVDGWQVGGNCDICQHLHLFFGAFSNWIT